MKDLLFLAHRIPYPPNKGDKIRSFNILKYLSARYRVHLGAFIDDPGDWQYAEVLKVHCASTHFVPLHPKLALLRSAQGLLTGEALGIPYYRDSRMSRWVRELSGRLDLGGVYVYSSTMAQYASHLTLPSKVLDFCDVDSEKWRQYAERHGFPRAWVYGREARLLADEERRLAERFSAVVLVSNSEADLFRRVAPAASRHTHTVRNGVDTEYFDPKLAFDSPFKAGESPIVFTGAMDYWANVDAVQWFVKEVLPRVSSSQPNARFYIVGSRPADAVLALGRQPNVVVTGTVPDVRPYLAHSRVVVAPLRIARGIQNKVLEALAMGRPLVATGDALDGLEGVEASGALAANDPTAFSAALDRALAPGFDVAQRARGYVCEHFGWDASLRILDQLLVPAVHSGAA
jgi:sugar transferase (PEP-CTERM/EpsH1 system associated)